MDDTKWRKENKLTHYTWSLKFNLPLTTLLLNSLCGNIKFKIFTCPGTLEKLLIVNSPEPKSRCKIRARNDAIRDDINCDIHPQCSSGLGPPRWSSSLPQQDTMVVLTSWSFVILMVFIVIMGPLTRNIVKIKTMITIARRSKEASGQAHRFMSFLWPCLWGCWVVSSSKGLN